MRSTPSRRSAGGVLAAWWPALLWAGAITYASSGAFSSANTGRLLEPLVRWLYPAVSVEGLAVIHHVVRKAAHFGEYFVFYPLLYRGLGWPRLEWRWSHGLGAWALAAAFSVLDELHQSFVASRTASPWDSLLDSAGALAALPCLLLLLRRVRRRQPAEGATS